MHYSVIPYETAFAPPADEESVQPYMTTEYCGVKMDVSRSKDGVCRIQRLYSTDPKIYLKKEFQIGTEIILPAQPD